MTHEPKAELLIDDTWVDVSSRLRDRSPVTIRRGRDDELAQATPSQLKMVLENADGALTPRNPESLYYPHWAKGTRCRVSVPGGTTALHVPGVDGSNASTPDVAALDITGTITVLARIDPEAWTGLTYSGNSATAGGHQRIASKWDIAGNNFSWHLSLNGAANIVWEWSSAGSVVTGARQSPQVFASLKPVWVGVTFRPNNGAAGNTIVWWTSDDGVTFTEVHSETQSGTTSIFSGAANVEIGTRNQGVASYRGRVLAARIINGELAGTVVANPDFTAQTIGVRTFTDSAGRVWSLNGTAEISDRTIRGVGQIDEISVDWPHAERRDSPRDGVSHVSVSASGMLRRMTQGAKPVVSTLFRGVTRQDNLDNIVAYWPMEDGPDTTRAWSPIEGVRPMELGGPSWRLAAESSLHASKPLPTVPAGGVIGYRARVPTYTATQSRVDIFARIDTPNAFPNGTFVLSFDTTSATGHHYHFAVDDTNVTFQVFDVNNTLIDSLTSPSDPRMFDTWCLWSTNIEQNGGNTDWQLDVVPIPLGLAFTYSGNFAATVGAVTAIHNWGQPAPTSGGISFGHLIVTTDKALGWLSGYDSAWLGETAAHRFRRLCDEEDIPVHVFGDPNVVSSFRGDELLSAPMGYQGQRTLVDLLTECATVDGGIMSEHRTAPVLDYRTRRDLYNQDVALTLNTNLGGIDREFTPVDDDQRVRNDVTATRTDGSSHRVTTTPEPGPGEVYDVDITLNVESDLQLPDQAGWRLHLGTWPAMRYPGLGTSLRRAGAYIAKVWSDIALGDRVRLDQLPSQHEQTTDLLLEGYTETLSFFDWHAAFNASPAGPWTVGVREDDVLGVRDTAGSELNSSFAAGTATSMSVVTTLGPLWAVTAAANSGLPFDLNVGGYQIHCTAIGAAAGAVQTFTVTAAIGNGLAARTLAAGTPVSLWTPARRAL